jgi:hypothetical protein
VAGLKLAELQARWGGALQQFARSGRGGKIPRGAGIAFTALISLYLIFRLTRIGWGNVWDSIPATPWFYLAVVAKYLTLPFFQAIVLKVIWKNPLRQLIPVSLNKRILDKNLVDLAGDAYLFNWARSHVPASAKQIILALKDNLLISSAVSVFIALGLLGLFLALGLVSLPEGWLASQWRYVPVVVLATLAVAALVFRFRKSVFSLEKRTLWSIFLLHLARTLAVQVIQVAEWAVVLPRVGLDRWITLLAVNIIISNIPFLPSRNLIFFGAGLEISGHLALPIDDMAGIFLTASVLGQLLNLFFFVWASCSIGRAKKPGGAAGGQPFSGRAGGE